MRTRLPDPAPADLNQPMTNDPREWADGIYPRAGKRMLDIALVMLSAPLTLALTALCAAALWLEGGAPFYRQDRLRADGSRYRILKLRTMVRNADTLLERYLEADPELRREWETTQKLKQDPRVTPLGRMLRATSLDELPQLWNVLTGDMSLVGPRPVMPDQLALYGASRLYFGQKPGLSGLWQVSARNEQGFFHRAEMDSAYFRAVSLKTDMAILLKTVGVVVRRTGY